MADGPVIKIFGGNDLIDDFVFDLLADLLRGDFGAVLRGNDNSVDSLRNDGAIVMLVLKGNLRLRVGAEPREGSVTSSGRQGRVEPVSHEKSDGEEFGGLVSSIAEHDALDPLRRALRGSFHSADPGQCRATALQMATSRLHVL